MDEPKDDAQPAYGAIFGGDGIDYEKLAKAADDRVWANHRPRYRWEEKPTYYHKQKDVEARAVVAAYEQQLREQGMAVVRREDLGLAIEWGAICRDTMGQWVSAADEPAYDRINAAYTGCLVAPGDGGEEENP